MNKFERRIRQTIGIVLLVAVTMLGLAIGYVAVTALIYGCCHIILWAEGVGLIKVLSILALLVVGVMGLMGGDNYDHNA